jgi:hypothetical protein
MEKCRNIQAMKLLILTFLLTIATACSDSFLDVPPQGKVKAEDFFLTEADATEAVNSIYGNLRGWTNVAFAPMALESLGSDDAEKGSDPSDASFLNAFDNFTVTATEGQIYDFWSGRYLDINLCNQLIDNIQNIPMNEGLKARYVAEAKFARAYAYFRLVRAFGDIPLRLTVPKGASEFNIPRTPKAEVYAAIERDLTEAASVLPVSYTGSDIGKFTRGAALSLNAKVAMYQNKWTEVRDLTNQVIALGYTLFPNYYQLFRVANENSSESIFEIQATLVPGNGAVSNSQYSQIQGVRGTDAGWGFNVPTQDLADFYEAGDPRRDATIIFSGEITPDGDAIPSNTPNPRYNQKSYVPFSQLDLQLTPGCQQNVRVIRFADVLLMNAEANNELGNASAALASLELVRARARNGNNAILPQVTTTDQAQLRQAIWRERRAELAMEFDRYFDVIRQGRGLQVFGPKGWKANKNEVWPIPQREIDLSSGVLVQNPGY